MVPAAEAAVLAGLSAAHILPSPSDLIPYRCSPAPPQPPAHDVAQLLQVGGCEVPVVAVAPLHVLLDAVQVHCVQVQQLRLPAHRRGRKQLHPNSSQRLILEILAPPLPLSC